MVAEQEETRRALQIALQMETDGKAFYLKAGQESGNELGKELMRSLAAEEDIHRQKFEEIYEAISRNQAWPVITLQPDRSEEPRAIFVRAAKKLGSSVKVMTTELDAVQRAMDMENRTYDFYQSRADKAGSETERGFYQALAAEEKVHHLILLDYYEYLKDPAAWFVNKEHPSLDGG